MEALHGSTDLGAGSDFLLPPHKDWQCVGDVQLLVQVSNVEVVQNQLAFPVEVVHFQFPFPVEVVHFQIAFLVEVVQFQLAFLVEVVELQLAFNDEVIELLGLDFFGPQHQSGCL